jgi:hypothetical protein
MRLAGHANCILVECASCSRFATNGTACIEVLRKAFPFSDVEKPEIPGKYTLQPTTTTTVDIRIEVDRMENGRAKPDAHLSRGLQKAVAHPLRSESTLLLANVSAQGERS